MADVESRLRELIDDLISSRGLQPGDRIPTERDLVEQLEAPRSAVRRALRHLEIDGQVTRWVGRGTFLSSPDRPAVEAVPPSTGPAEIMQARTLVEPPLAAVAAHHAHLHDLAHLDRLLEVENQASTFEESEDADTSIHRGIARAAHSDLLLSIFDLVNSARDLPVWGSLKRRSTTPERRAAYHASHQTIVDALHDRDSTAARAAMDMHVRAVTADILGPPHG